MDIVERLRKRKEIIIAANPNGVITQVDRDAIEAADEIERLREALQKIVDYDWSWEGGGKLGKIEGFCAKIARSALQQKDRE